MGPPGNRLSSGSSDVRQLLEVDLDRLDRVGRDRLDPGRHREDRFADIEHLVLGQDRRLRRRELRHVVGGEDAEHARHLQRRRRVDVADLRVRHRAGQHLAEHHALGAEILGVFRPAGDLRHDVVRRRSLLPISLYAISASLRRAHDAFEVVVVGAAPAEIAGHGEARLFDRRFADCA